MHSPSRNSIGTLITIIFAFSLTARAVQVGSPDNPNALPAALAKAYADGAREITITPGTYLLPEKGGDQILFDAWVDTTIQAEGVTIIAGNVGQKPVQFRKCERVVFKGALIRYASPSFTQGRIVSIQKNGKDTTVDWRIDAGYEIPTGSTPGSLDVVDQSTRLLRVGTGDFNASSSKLVEPGLLRLIGVSAGFGTAQVGDWIFTRISRGGLVDVRECVNCTFQNLTLQNSGFAAFFEGGGSGNRFVDCRIVPGPRPPGATEDQLVGCGADGFHSAGTTVGPSIEGMVFEGVLHDDCIAIHGSFQSVYAL